jgi:hypothetical protein
MKKTTSLNKAQKGWVYGVIDMKGTLGYFDPMGLPIIINKKETTLGGLITRLNKYELLNELTLQKLGKLKLAIRRYLLRAGYDLPKETLNEILEGIEAVQVLNPHDDTAIALLKDGFISEIVDIELGQVLRNETVPSDIELGYYKVEHGKIVEDIKRKEETLMLD